METFLIRVWRPAEEDDDLRRSPLRGFVEHVRVGDRRPFESGAELLALLEGSVARPRLEAGERHREITDQLRRSAP